MSTNNNPHKENAEISFDELFNNSINGVESFESQVAKGKILSYNKDFVIIDVGLKSEGKIPISEFKDKKVIYFQ
jgi:small subunit ribosomal protein S1